MNYEQVKDPDKLTQALQIGERISIPGREILDGQTGRDQGLIESGFQQIKLLREKPTDLIATINFINL